MMNQAIKVVRAFLPSTGSVTMKEIEDSVDKALKVCDPKLNKKSLIKEIQSIYNIRIDEFKVIEGAERKIPWVRDKKASIKWNFWNRYYDYLLQEKNFSTSVVNNLDRLTDRILDGLFDPTKNIIIDKKGLCAGLVQSGKTSNYTGLICKAADAGFKLIIVLAGIHNNLRAQTQLRLDEGFLGFDTQFERAFSKSNSIGVGRFNSNSVAHSLTSSKDDFKAGLANSGINFNTNDTIIAVVKKNATILDRLLRWLYAQSVEIDERQVIRNKSLLIIDDEADNASINTNPDNDNSTRINGLIRDILRLFDKSGYVGYTATPFANIFIPINEDELFPRDFIINLPAPSNYIGPDKIFGFTFNEDRESENTLPIVARINDYQNFVPDRHKNYDALPIEAPDSLKLAIKCFILTCAIRELRGQRNVHNSMLIHVSRFQRWQTQVKDIVQDVFDYYRRGIEFNIAEIIEEIKAAFEKDKSGYKSYQTTSKLILNSSYSDLDNYIEIHKWEDVLPVLHESASKIQVKEINGGSADALNYYDHRNGLSVIAIGGNKLSRGLTLEGLSVSYYLRASRMYDTLMQMGRWFGYRHGYLDLCRLFTSSELNEWFCHIALATEELRNEFDYMSDNAGSTPEQYALRVRTHPGVLQISASNKIRRAENVQVSWSGRLVETYELSKKNETIKQNLDSTLNLINSLGRNYETGKNYFLWENISYNKIKKFLLKFSIYDNLKSASPQNIVKFIDYKYDNNELQFWNIGLITKSSGRAYEINNDITVNLIDRTQDDTFSDTNVYYIRKSHILDPDNEFIDLTDPEKDRAMEATRNLWRQKGKKGEPTRINGHWVRNEIRKPNKVLILLYFLNPVGAGLPSSSNPITAFAISFPGTERNDAVTYAVHEQLLDKFDYDDLIETEDTDDED